MARSVLQLFEDYQRARVRFSQGIADMATRPQHVDALQSSGAMALLRPLLLDTVPSVQQSAALAIGRLANYNEDLAQAVVDGEILPQLRFYKKSAAYVLRSVAKHSTSLAQAVVDSGAVEALVGCLDEFDPGVKESCTWALGYVSRHSTELARAVVETGDAIALLVHCLEHPELDLKRVAASCLADIAKHSPELAQAVVDKRAIDQLAPLITSPDTKLKRQACQTLAQIAKHSVELAEAVVEGKIIPRIFTLFQDPDEVSARNAAICVREVVRHTPELAQLAVNGGCVPPLVEFTARVTGPSCLAGVMTLGFIGSFSESLAVAVITGGGSGVVPLKAALVREPEEHIRATAAWSLGQLGQHSPQHAKSVTDADVLPLLLRVMKEGELADGRRNAKKLRPLEDLLQEEPPPGILRHVCVQVHAVLRQPDAVDAKKSFVSHGGLKRLLDARDQPDVTPRLKEAIDSITSLYPKDVIRHFSRTGMEGLIDGIQSTQDVCE